MMTAFVKYLVASVLLLAGIRAASQPLLPESDYIPGGQTGMHLFLPSEFLDSIRADRLQLARIRNLSAAYDRAVAAGDYLRAFTYTDSLISISENRIIPGVHFTKCYEDRARMLEALHRNTEACAAYDRAVQVRDSVMHIEQDQEVREMQASYELDRLALDKALLTARHHRMAALASALLLAAMALIVGFIYVANRRTRRLQQELLLQREEALHSEEKKTAFIDSICHEVRTPLNSIAGFSELLCEEPAGTEAHGQYCEIIAQSRRQLRYLFDDMLEVAYLENLQEPLPHGYLDLGALCHTRLRTMKVRFQKPGITYVEQVPAEEMGIDSNEKYLGILLDALLGNANKFTRKGSITLFCDREGDDRVRIRISDTGCGIPREHHAYVFERFTKLDPFSQGNGLGLYLCRLIVRRLGGTIRIDAEQVQGTCIEVTLPRRPRPEKRDTTGGHTPHGR